MQITFAPTDQNVDTVYATPQRGTVIEPVGIPYLEVPSTTPPTTPYDGVIVDGGSQLYPIMGGPVYNLSFYKQGTVIKVDDFAMDSAAAIAAITLNSDGTLGS